MSEKLSARLKELHKLTAQTPLFNPVFQLGLDLSRDLESGRTDLKQINTIVKELECEALQIRAQHLHSLIAPTNQDENLARFRELVEKSAKENKGDFEGFNQIWSRPFLNSVFTAHPTFLLNRDESERVAEAASIGKFDESICAVNSVPDTITLDYEHEDVSSAISNAINARDKLCAVILEVAQSYFPKSWQELSPAPFAFATWVGYDMDGRTDILWHVSIKYRILEKSIRLGLYASSAAQLGLKEIADKLNSAKAHCDELLGEFDNDLSNPENLSRLANQITEAKDNLLSLGPIIEAIRDLAKAETTKKARDLLVLSAAMQIDGLGLGQIHFRINSAQLNNAIRRNIAKDDEGELSSGVLLKRIQTLLKKVKPLRSNFAALAIETTTALRQFLAMAQILKHIDNDAPIRLLIAECEQPYTVLFALYFAKLFGIDDKIDISPLFETESAMEHGARFLDALLAEPIYRQYVRGRGRIAIQTGFSDAGRFVGQIPAALAIERLHGRLARFMAKHQLTDVSALIFNTHGESMGRGAHPVSMRDRLTYPMSEWARAQFAKNDIVCEKEISFQGGDGYLFFRRPELALSTLVRIAEVEASIAKTNDDPFYKRTDLSLDFYRGIRRIQRQYLNSSAYSRTVTAFGLGLLKDTGSRKSRRQSDLAADRDMSLRQIRAIPHNAILQQLGYPINILAGVGTAASAEGEALAELINNSERGQQLLRMVAASNALASIKSLAAYGDVFNCAYWASRPYRGTESYLENACLALAEKLEGDDRPGEIRRLASSLRVDGLKYHRFLALLDKQSENTKREDLRRSLGVLQALRLCLMQHMFLRAVQIPAFSRRNDISRDDVLEMIFSLRIDEALVLLRRAFPVSSPTIKDFSLSEPTDYPRDEEQAYQSLHEDYFDKIELAYKLCLKVGVSIANHFGAHG